MLVIFDFDGTLADTWDLFADELVAGPERLQIKPLDRRQVEDLRRLDTREIFRALGVPWWRLPKVVSHLRRRAAELTDKVRLFPGMRDVVLELSTAGHALAVVSSNAESTVRAVLGEELGACFHYFDCSSSVFGKAVKFRKLRRRSGLPASAVVAIGDETRDLEAAEAAGIAGLAVAWGFNEPNLLRTLAPDRTAGSPRELSEMLARYARHGRFG